MAPEMMRAGELAQRLYDFTNNTPERQRHHAVLAEAPALCQDALVVIKDLMDEIQRRDIREDHARTKADELVGWLNGRWG